MGVTIEELVGERGEVVMAIKISCPECKKVYNLQDSMAGKKIRCKGCDGVFVVKATVRPTDEEAEDDYEEEERRPSKRGKKRGKKAETPVWVWAATGGGLLVVIAAGIGFYLMRSPGTPAKSPAPQQAAESKPAKIAPPGKPRELGSILEEYRQRVEAAAVAMEQIRDAASADAAGKRLVEEAAKIQALAPAVSISLGNPADVMLTNLNVDKAKERANKAYADCQTRLASAGLPDAAFKELDRVWKVFTDAEKEFDLARRNKK
jgi:hypothetical protein